MRQWFSNFFEKPSAMVLNTLGKLAEHGYGVGGYCMDCRRLFAVSLTVLMLERGRDFGPRDKSLDRRYSRVHSLRALTHLEAAGLADAPAEIVLRLLIHKHVRNWSYGVLEREVRANLVYRDFTRVGAGKAPDAKTMGRWRIAVGPEVVKQIQERMVEIAQNEGVAQGRRMRLDTTVVETNIHYPTDSSLLGDGVRVLTRTMRTSLQRVSRSMPRSWSSCVSS
jgi:hypothetical protein